MKITRLSLHDFRNIADATLEPHERFNVIHGDNAQGKTNLLEAIYLLSALRSFKAATNGELVRWGEAEAVVRGVVSRREVVRDIRINVKPGARTVHIDGKRPRRLQESFGSLTAVLFAPEDLAISKGSPSNRRSFLDRAVFNVFPGYYDDSRAYETAVRSRNALLRGSEGRAPARDVMSVFDAQVAAAGARVVDKRLRFLAAFVPRFTETHGQLVRGRHEVVLSYESRWAPTEPMPVGEIEQALAQRLTADLARDVGRGATSSGPHSDDLGVLLDGRPARLHASQGQHRTMVLAMKIAEILYLHENLGYYPVLLLDDVSSELDRHRNAELMGFLQETGVQVFVTTTDSAHVQTQGSYHSYAIGNGAIVAQTAEP